MIEAFPCGCKPKQLYRKYQIKRHLIQKDLICFDDPRCEEHEGGTSIMGFMSYQNEEVKSIIFQPDDSFLEAQLSIDAATDHIYSLYENGFDFSYSKGRLEKSEDGTISIICGRG